MPAAFRTAAALLLLAAAPAAAQPDTLRTRAERTDWRETTRYDEAMAFLRAVDAASDRVHLSSFGYTMEGRPLPVAVVGAVADASPEAVRRSGKTVVYLQGNIHAGEVEGKEVLLALLRAAAAGRMRPAWADSLVLLVAPVYNADGNERVTLANRPDQHGPVGGMGQRPNAQGLDLNRDHTKLDAPEARSLAALLTAYDPHVVVDLHTTNGTYHAYRLTYAPPLHPNTPRAIDQMLRGRWLPAVTQGIKARDGWDVYYYGNVPDPESTWAAARGAERGWYTFDHRPRFGTNYAGLRNRFGILSEAYAYLTFRERADVTRRFVEEVLDWASAHAGEIRSTTAAADRQSLPGTRLATTARTVRTGPVTILMGAVTTEPHPYTGEPVRRRLDVMRPEPMPEFGTFEAADTEVVPAAYLLPPELRDAAWRLAAHGVRLDTLATAETRTVEAFRIDSTRQAERPFQNRRERTLWGRWETETRTLPAGTVRVRMDQPLARLVFTLLEPRSDDGFAAWGVLDEALKDGAAYPVTREPTPQRR